MAFKFEDDLLIKANNDYEKFSKLKNELSYAEYCIDSSYDIVIENDKKIDSLKSEIEKLSEERNVSWSLIEKYEKQKPIIETKIEKIKKSYNSKIEKIAEKRIRAFKKYIKTINNENEYVCKLTSDTRTVELLDIFCKSEKDFLVLENQFYLPNNRTYISLIITKYYGGMKITGGQPTMTELKKSLEKNIRSIAIPRLKPLVAYLTELDNQSNTLKSGKVVVFDNMFLVGGQTSSNRMNYGCEWIGGGDYIENTLYGEVTDFMVVGFRVDDGYYYW